MSVQIKKHYASFSEAMREGALLRPQCRTVYFMNGGSCAYGAGMEALFGREAAELAVYSVSELYPYLGDDCSKCPMDNDCDTAVFSLSNMIFHLNDDHNWSREEIAGWLHEYEDSIGYVTLIEEAKESAQELVTV